MKTMKATVTGTRDGATFARVSRSSRVERIDGYHPDLKIGQVVEVVRQPNNPFLRLAKGGRQ